MKLFLLSFLFCASLVHAAENSFHAFAQQVNNQDLDSCIAFIQKYPEVILTLENEANLDSLVGFVSSNYRPDEGEELFKVIINNCNTCSNELLGNLNKTLKYFEGIAFKYTNNPYSEILDKIKTNIDFIESSSSLNKNDSLNLFSLYESLGEMYLRKGNTYKSKTFYHLSKKYAGSFCYPSDYYLLSADLKAENLDGLIDKINYVIKESINNDDKDQLARVYQKAIEYYLALENIDSAYYYLNLSKENLLRNYPPNYYLSKAKIHSFEKDLIKEVAALKKAKDLAKEQTFLFPNTILFDVALANSFFIADDFNLAKTYFNLARNQLFFNSGDSKIIIDEIKYLEVLVGLSKINALEGSFNKAELLILEAEELIHDKFNSFSFEKDKFHLLESYSEIISIYIDHKKEFNKSASDILFLMEKAKALSLLDELSIRSNLKNSLGEKEYSLFTEWELILFDLENKIKLIYRSNENTVDLELFELQNEQLRIKQRIDSLLTTIDQTELIKQLNKDVHLNLINSNKSILNLFSYENKGILILINNDTILTNEFDIDSSLSSNIDFVLSHILEKESSLKVSLSLKKIYDYVISPLNENLNENLLIIPHGVFSTFPFEILLDKKNNYLIQNHTISYSYSLNLLAAQMEYSNTNKNLRVLGFAPNYDKLFPLFSTTKEVKFIEKSFKSSICFYDDQANKKAFIDHCRNSDIIHIASHADINAFDDDYSYIAFSDVHYDNEGDYLLYLRELVSLDLNAELIVLSACNTSLGSYKKGEGILSLARGFVSAGCSSIVSSLWEVDDASTQELMESFYSHLLLGEDKSLALANAKRSYLKTHTGEKLSPYFWGGFVALGDMKPICSPNNGIKYAVYGFFFLGLLFFFRKKLMKPFSAN